MSVKIGEKFGLFEIVSAPMASALADYDQLHSWFKENSDKDHQDACNELYQWFVTADNKASLAFYYIAHANE